MIDQSPRGKYLENENIEVLPKLSDEHKNISRVYVIMGSRDASQLDLIQYLARSTARGLSDINAEPDKSKE